MANVIMQCDRCAILEELLIAERDVLAAERKALEEAERMAELYKQEWGRCSTTCAQEQTRAEAAERVISMLRQTILNCGMNETVLDAAIDAAREKDND